MKYNSRPDAPQKPLKLLKPDEPEAYDPAQLPSSVEELDPVSRRILEIEIANPGISARKIREVGKLTYDLTTINARRKSPIYQRLLYESQRSAIELVRDTQAEAVRTIRALMADSDPAIRLKAALFFAEPARSLEVKRQEFEFEQEAARTRLAMPPEPMVVEVILPPDMRSIVDREPLPAPEAALADGPPSAVTLVGMDGGAPTMSHASEQTFGDLMGMID